jgi:hypothetical protein
MKSMASDIALNLTTAQIHHQALAGAAGPLSPKSKGPGILDGDPIADPVAVKHELTIEDHLAKNRERSLVERDRQIARHIVRS